MDVVIIRHCIKHVSQGYLINVIEVTLSDIYSVGRRGGGGHFERIVEYLRVFQVVEHE